MNNQLERCINTYLNGRESIKNCLASLEKNFVLSDALKYCTMAKNKYSTDEFYEEDMSVRAEKLEKRLLKLIP